MEYGILSGVFLSGNCATLRAVQPPLAGWSKVLAPAGQKFAPRLKGSPLPSFSLMGKGKNCGEPPSLTLEPGA